jgi:hypothetical protein
LRLRAWHAHEQAEEKLDHRSGQWAAVAGIFVTEATAIDFDGLAADLATGARSERLDQMLSNLPPSRLPSEPIAGMGATARIRWSDIMAGREL